MKKLLVYFIGFSFLAVTLYNCTDDKEQIYTRGINIYVSNKHTYPLNSGVQGTVSVSDEDVSKIAIYKDEQKLTDVNLSGGVGDYDLPKSNLGLSDVGDEVYLKFSTDIDGTEAARYYSFVMADPLTIDGPDFVPPVDDTVTISYALEDDCDDPTTLEISKAVNSGAYTPLTGTFDLRSGDISVDITSDMASDTLKYKFHFENANGQYDAEHQIIVQVEREWDFEKYDSWTTDFAPWTLDDRDGLPVYTVGSFDYPGEGDSGSWRIFDYADASANGASAAWEAHSGDKYAFCFAAIPDGTTNNNDDWMISDNFDIEAGYELDMFAKSITDTYGLERMIVKVVDNDTGDAVELTNSPYTEVPTDWTNYNWSLDNWAGKNIHIEIGCVSSDAFALFVDDFKILTPNSSRPVYENDFEDSSSKSAFVGEKIK